MKKLRLLSTILLAGATVSLTGCDLIKKIATEVNYEKWSDSLTANKDETVYNYVHVSGSHKGQTIDLYYYQTNPEIGWNVDGSKESVNASSETITVIESYFGKTFFQNKGYYDTLSSNKYVKWYIDNGVYSYVMEHESLKTEARLNKGGYITYYYNDIGLGTTRINLQYSINNNK